MTPLIAVNGLQVHIDGRLVVDVPALEVSRGELFVLLGPTGAGKSTLLQTLGLLRKPSAGSIHWSGTAIPWPPPLDLRRRMAMVFQDPLLFEGTVEDNIAYGLRVRGLPKTLRHLRVRDAMALFHIEHLANRRASTLSGGEAQRVALARALAVAPDLLLLDEPLANLDAPIRERLIPDLKAALRTQNLTCIFVTHHQREALTLADRIAILNQGRLEQVDAPTTVFRRPATPFVARFVGIPNLWPGRILRREGPRVEVQLENLRVWAESPLPPGTDVLVSLRADRVRLHPRLPEGAQGWEATLASIQDQLHTRALHLTGPQPLWAHHSTFEGSPGMSLAVEVRPDDLHLIPQTDAQGTPSAALADGAEAP